MAFEFTECIPPTLRVDSLPLEGSEGIQALLNPEP